jgi:hypothetical protein
MWGACTCISYPVAGDEESALTAVTGMTPKSITPDTMSPQTNALIFNMAASFVNETVDMN